MKLYDIFIIIIMLILAFLGLLFIIMLFISFYFYKKNNTNIAIKNAIQNLNPPCKELFCSQIFLTQSNIKFVISNNSIYLYITIHNNKIINLIKPKIYNITTTKNYGIALYCAYLITLLGIDNNNIKPIINPYPLHRILEMYNDPAESIFGIMWSSSNVIFIVFRGTNYIIEWLQDLTTYQKYFSKTNNNQKQTNLKSLYSINSKIFQTLTNEQLNNEILVHEGFLNIYNKFRNNLINKLNKLITPETVIIISGHSLGGAIATICSLDLSLNFDNEIITYTFAAPSSGNTAYANLINNQKNINLYRIVNLADIVPSGPFSTMPNFTNNYDPNIYTHAGKIDNLIQFNENWNSLTNNHLLPVYIWNLLQF